MTSIYSNIIQEFLSKMDFRRAHGLMDTAGPAEVLSSALMPPEAQPPIYVLMIFDVSCNMALVQTCRNQLKPVETS